jgi:ribosomal protein L16 Arg81 hydroxylase
MSPHSIPPAAGNRLSFESLIAPLCIDEFEAEVRGVHAWRQAGQADRFENLLSWPTLNQLIRDQRPTSPRFRVMKAGRAVPESTYHRVVETGRGPLRMLDPARLLAHARAGATLVWDAIDQAHQPIRTAKQAIERALGGFAFVNMYASWGDTGGLDDHWDDHDVFVLQVLGRKNWQIEAPTQKWPLAHTTGLEPPEKFEHDWTLSSGDVLYLPRGWWHRVAPVGEPSLHLTVGLLRPTNADFLQWLIDRGTKSDLLRQDFPSPTDGAAAHADALRRLMSDMITTSSLDGFARYQDDSHYLDPLPTLQAAGDTDLTSSDAGADAILLSTRARVCDGADGVVLDVAGYEFSAPRDADSALRALVDGAAVPLDELRAVVPGGLISELVAAGIIALVTN